jgi:hypothetical protein
MINALTTTDMLKKVAAIWMIACSALLFTFAVTHPLAEWDMLVYAASAEKLNGTPANEIHAKVYDDLQAKLSAEEFQRITQGDSYRTAMYEDEGAFLEQMPFYRIRVTFNSILAFAGRSGIGIYEAGHFVSATAFTICFLLVWLGFRQYIHPLFQLTMPVLFYKYTRELEVMQQILADSLASMWVAIICVAYTQKSRFLLPLIAVAVLVRVDLFIFSGLMLMLLLLTEPKHRFPAVFACGAFLVTAFLLVQNWADSYGWKTLYYFAFISEMSATHPSIYSHIAFTFQEYVTALYDPPRWISKMYLVTVLCSMVTLIFWNHARGLSEFEHRVCRVSGICIIYITAHYMIFPQMYLRFFVAQNFMVFTGFAVIMTCYIESRRRSKSLAPPEHIPADTRISKHP